MGITGSVPLEINTLVHPSVTSVLLVAIIIIASIIISMFFCKHKKAKK